MRTNVRHLAVTILATSVMWIGSAVAEPGVFPDKIVLGQSAVLNGPAAALGTGMREGLIAAFTEANKAGGVKGRKIELVTVDDGYEPNRAIENTKKLINEDKVFALVGAVGTPTSQAAQPVATEAGVPFIGPFTGAGFLRDPKLKNVVNLRASYGQETETWIEHLTKDLGYKRIAILYQDDAFGRAGLDGVKKAMVKRGMELTAEGTYERNTIAVKSAILAIRKGDPEAVVMVGAYAPCAEFIKLTKKLGMKTTFVNISFVGSDALAKTLGADGAGVVITQVVPLPWDASLPVTKAYQQAIKAADSAAEPGFVSLEGYMVGQLVIKALGQIDGEVTRSAFLSVIEKMTNFDLGGINLTYGPSDNQGMDDVFLTVIEPDGSFKAVSKLSK